MNAQELRDRQAPLKAQYRTNPETARLTLTASGRLSGRDLICEVATGLGSAQAGLHPATGGDGRSLCSSDMMLEALVGCAGVTLKAVATAMDIPLRGGLVTAEGDVDFRGTLGVDKTVPIGFSAVRLRFELDCDATPEQKATLLKLTERYCVVLQTLKNPPVIESVLVDSSN